MRTLIYNIGQLVQVINDQRKFTAGMLMQNLEVISDAWLSIEGGKILDFGVMPVSNFATYDQTIDASGKMVFPAFVDSHTHLVYAGSREIEYIDKIKGLSYEEIAKRGGGILNSAKRIADASEEELILAAQKRLSDIMAMGTGAVEIKSGYGLNTASELKMLRVISKLKKLSPMTIKSTFLGAHAVPREYRGRQSEYVNLVVNEMLPQVAEEGLLILWTCSAIRAFLR